MAQNVELRQQNTTPSTPVSGVCKVYVDSNKTIKAIDSSGRNYTTLGGTLASKIRPANILCSTLNIPVLSSGVSTDITVPLSGILINNNEVICTFFNNGVSTNLITGFKITNVHSSGIIIDPRGGSATDGGTINYWSLDGGIYAGRCLYLNTDYTKSMRFGGAFSEIYGQARTSVSQHGFTYSDLSPGPLIGYYNLSNQGVFQLNKNVQLNSAWLDGTGNAVFSFTCWDTGNTALNIKVGFYE